MQEVETFTRVAKLRELFPPALHLPNDLRDSRVEVLQGSGLSQSSFHFNEIDLIIHGEKSSNLNLGSLEPLQSDAILYRIWRGRASTSDVMRLSRVLTTFPLWLADIALRVCKSDISDEDSLGDIVTLRVQKNDDIKVLVDLQPWRKNQLETFASTPRGRTLGNIYQRSEGNKNIYLCHIDFGSLSD